MPRYRLPIDVPVFIDKVIVWPCLIWRWFWCDHAYRRVKVLPDKYAKVEPRDYHEISQYTWWAKESCGKYAAVRLLPGGNCGMVVYMHRQIMFGINPKSETLSRCIGTKPILRPKVETTEGRQNPNSNDKNSKLLVDHKNRDSMDNRRANLRFATKGQNNMNQGGRSGTSSKYKGVSWYKPKNCWRGMIKVEGKNKSLGYFESEVEAAKAYDEAARKYHKEYAYQNFCEEQTLSRRAKIRKVIRGLCLVVRDSWILL